jgi:hypothetical protein
MFVPAEVIVQIWFWGYFVAQLHGVYRAFTLSWFSLFLCLFPFSVLIMARCECISSEIGRDE